MKALSRVYYGWWVALALSGAIFFSHGIGFYVIPVVLQPLSQEFGWGRGVVSGMVAIYALARGVSAPGVGRLCDRYGVRRVMLLSAPVFGAALVLLSLTQSLWQLYVIYFLVSVAAGGLQTVPISAAVAAWFEQRRGTAMAIALAGMNLGGLAMAPLAPAFWLTSLSFFLVTGSFVGVLTHQVVFFTEVGIPPVMAAAVLGFTSGFGVLGKLVVGYLGDRLSKVGAALICFALQGAGVLLLIGAKNMAMVWLFALIFGAGMAATPVVYPLVVGEFFGVASLGSTYGWSSFFASFGTAAGAPLAGYIYDRTGSYYPAFLLFLLAYALAALCLLLAARWNRKGNKPGERLPSGREL